MYVYVMISEVTLRFNETLSCGMAVLEISYTGEMGKDMAGLYSSRYQGLSRGWKSMALTQFEAVDARRMLPCWDEPSRKAVFVGRPWRSISFKGVYYIPTVLLVLIDLITYYIYIYIYSIASISIHIQKRCFVAL